MKYGLIGFLAAGLLCPVGASAGVTGLINDLVGGKSAAADFAGTWSGPAGSDIDHIVVTASGSGPVRIQVFGRCEARVCNWGALPARIRTDGPTSEIVRSLSADFNLGFALRHITLHRQPGAVLRFDMVTEFTDGSERHDYEIAGQLVPAGVKVAAVPAAPSQAPAVQTAQVAPAQAAPAQVPASQPAAPAPVAAAPQPASPPSAAPPPPSAGSGISILNPLSWFSSKPSAPPSQPGPLPEDSSNTPVAVSASAPVEDCFTIDTNHVYLAPSNGNWNIRDFLHVVQNFGPYRQGANRGMTVIAFYRFDEVCHIGRGSTNMTFFRAAGEVPHQPLAGEDCSDVHTDKVVAVKKDDDWQVVDGNRVIFDYGSDQQGAEQAAGVIHSLNLARQCYYDRANLAASYWLSR